MYMATLTTRMKMMQDVKMAIRQAFSQVMQTRVHIRCLKAFLLSPVRVMTG